MEAEPFSARRRRPWGAEVFPDGVHFSVHAPRRNRVTLVLESEGGRHVPFEGDAQTGFQCFVPELRAGALYRLLLDDDPKAYPDPASRYQPEGPHGPSEVIDPSFTFRATSFAGVSLRGQVIYELHVGTFTREGTYRSAARELPHLAELGITVIELMPLAEFPGRFGWGYDCVDLFAPSHLYGRPDDLRSFIDDAHALGIAVLLDVVYYHLGPDGNYLPQFTDTFLSAQQRTQWGQAINFDGEGSQFTRAYYCDNAAYWIDEFRFDGLRLDATQEIFDHSETHVIGAIVASARAAAGDRKVLVIAENETQQASLARPPHEGGQGCDALWNDDFHHSAIAAATGRAEGYYAETAGTPQELISALKWGFLYQGQPAPQHERGRGEPALDFPAERFVLSLQNHDQLANSARGLRLHALTTGGRARALKTVLLLAPGTPMLFQGEEYDASTPFHYFADHDPALADMVRRGRVDYVRQFPSLRGSGVRNVLPDPSSPETFARSKLDARERELNAEAVSLTRDLIALRARDPVFAAQRSDRMHGAVLGPEAFVLRYFGDRNDDRLLLVNLGLGLSLPRAPEPLLAPPSSTKWQILFSSEDPEYGGAGTPPLDAYDALHLHGHAALVLAPVRR